MNERRRLHSICATFAFLAICAGIVMGFVADFGKRELPDGLHSPALAMQLIEADNDAVRKILGPRRRPGRRPGRDDRADRHRLDIDLLVYGPVYDRCNSSLSEGKPHSWVCCRLLGNIGGRLKRYGESDDFESG